MNIIESTRTSLNNLILKHNDKFNYYYKEILNQNSLIFISKSKIDLKKVYYLFTTKRLPKQLLFKTLTVIP